MERVEGDDWAEQEREFDRLDDIALDVDNYALIGLALAFAGAGLAAVAFILTR